MSLCVVFALNTAASDSSTTTIRAVCYTHAPARCHPQPRGNSTRVVLTHLIHQAYAHTRPHPPPSTNPRLTALALAPAPRVHTSHADQTSAAFVYRERSRGSMEVRVSTLIPEFEAGWAALPRTSDVLERRWDPGTPLFSALCSSRVRRRPVVPIPMWCRPTGQLVRARDAWDQCYLWPTIRWRKPEFPESDLRGVPPS
ncbi:hypothetical protein OH77DRAFT_1286102 [Trametes cingulata]|nr:hypothetical protein OH77DRAFT_1286102 [Trametes cingulata]